MLVRLMPGIDEEGAEKDDNDDDHDNDGKITITITITIRDNEPRRESSAVGSGAALTA